MTEQEFLDENEVQGPVVDLEGARRLIANAVTESLGVQIAFIELFRIDMTRYGEYRLGRVYHEADEWVEDMIGEEPYKSDYFDDLVFDNLLRKAYDSWH